MYNIDMDNITFDWDSRKASLNEKKHCISFDEAKTVFFDEHAKVIHDPDHSDIEERYIILGMSSVTRVLVICHCYREDDQVIRIISARKASRTETRQYKGNYQ